LTQEEIDKMRKDAEANADADKKAKEKVEKLNEADSMIFQTESQLKELGDKLSDANKSNVEAALAELKTAYDSKDIDVIQPAIDKMNAAWKAASEDMYKQGEAAQGQPQQDAPQDEASQGDNVQDVDYEEVK